MRRFIKSKGIDGIELSKETKDDVMKEFRKLEVYKQHLDHLQEEYSELSYEDRISYPSSMRSFELGVSVSGSFGRTGQPERDTIHFEEKDSEILRYQILISDIEDSLDAAIAAAIENAPIHMKNRVRTAIYRHLVYNIPVKSTGLGSATFAKYKRLTMAHAACNLVRLGYIQDDEIEDYLRDNDLM